jgi:hypothetical protein
LVGEKMPYSNTDNPKQPARFALACITLTSNSAPTRKRHKQLTTLIQRARAVARTLRVNKEDT